MTNDSKSITILKCDGHIIYCSNRHPLVMQTFAANKPARHLTKRLTKAFLGFVDGEVDGDIFQND